MREYAMFIVKTMLLLSLPACQDLSAIQEASGPAPAQQDGADLVAGASTSSTFEDVSLLATEQGLIGSHGSNFSYIDKDAKGNLLVVHETFSSRTQYKTLTPVIDTQSSSIFIDCTLIRSSEDIEIIAVGNYCRGRSIATSDAIDDAVSDQWTRAYSSSLPWLNDAAAKVECAQPKGLDFMGFRILRCQEGEDNGTTTNVATHVLSSDLVVKLSMRGFEFAGSIRNEDSLVFWRLNESSHHEIVQEVVR
ncbi:hypothetical protein WCE37_03730 [Luteimonas sp. MJ250]|uniref:hypothetical protein n=1 Tax=Luteimonas sp. MJ250 TaxID=3129236 RepID=UPI0031BB36D7